MSYAFSFRCSHCLRARRLCSGTRSVSFSPPQEARIKSIEDRLAALEAKTTAALASLEAKTTAALALQSPKLPTWSVMTYPELIARVSKGERVQVAHGVTSPIGVAQVEIPNTAPGVYECYPSDAGPMMIRVSAPALTTAVQSGVYNSTGSISGHPAGCQCIDCLCPGGQCPGGQCPGGQPQATFPTPVRSSFYNMTGYPLGGSTCPGGQCPTPRR